MIFSPIFILFIFDGIFFSESVIFKSPHETVNFGFETNIPLPAAAAGEFFLQKLDHFNPTDDRTWKQVCI